MKARYFALGWFALLVALVTGYGTIAEAHAWPFICAGSVWVFWWCAGKVGAR